MEHFCADQFWVKFFQGVFYIGHCYTKKKFDYLKIVLNEFCLLDWNLTWGNHRPYPEFTECFRSTVLQCLGSMWLWLSVPIYVYVLRRYYRSDPLPRSCLATARQSILVAQLSVRFLQLQSVLAKITHRGDTYWHARAVGLAAEGITMLSVVAVMEVERQKHFVTSGVLSVYWVLTSLSAASVKYSETITEKQGVQLRENSLLYAWLGFALCQLALCCFAEELPRDHGKKACPLTRSSFFTRLAYSWMGHFMKIIHKRPLESRDFSKLMPSEQSETAIARFEETWTNEVDLQRKKIPKKSSKQHISLLKVILKTYSSDLMGSNGLKLVGTVVDLILPFLLGCLIGLVEDSTIPTWKGYVYLASFILCLGLYFVTTNYVWHLSNCIGQRLRACIVNAIYKKSLRMTNQARSESTVGEIVNLISTDLKSLKDCLSYVWVFWCYPTYIICSFVLLYGSIGVGAFAGLAVFIVVLPFNAYLAKVGHVYQKERMDKKDDRIKLLTEIFNGIKILKLYAWELAFGETIKDMRQNELAILKKQRLVGMIGSFSWCIAPFLVGIISLATYVYLNADHVLTAQTAFVALGFINLMGDTFHELPHIISDFLKAWVALERLDKFLNQDDINPDNVTHHTSDAAISIKNGTFTWDPEIGSVLKNINVTVPRGSLVAVVGRVGTGKSSLLSAILGEVEKTKGAVNVDGDIAYVPQLAWIQNDTLQNNILFGQKLNSRTYKAVTDACALAKDLDILPGRDQTEIGEKGINLSGGQKQRVSMARAVYHNADIYLLDDPLSAVDAHVGKHIFEHAIGNKGFLRNKTRVLVTHGLTWLPEVDKIFVMDNGVIAEAGSYTELIGHKGAFARFIREYKPDLPLNEDGSDVEDAETATNKYEHMVTESGHFSGEKNEKQNSSEPELTENQNHIRRSISRALSHENKTSGDTADDSDDYMQNTLDGAEKAKTLAAKEKGKFVEEEEIEVGKVQLKYIIPYISAFGKTACLLILVFFSCYKVGDFMQGLWVKQWTNDEDLKNLTSMPSESEARHIANLYYVGVYAALGVFQGSVLIIYEALIAFAITRAATKLHERMLTNVLRGKMSFFDTTPVGRIISRFSQDMDAIDGDMCDQIEWFLHSTLGVLCVFLIILYSIPTFIMMAIPVTIVAIHMQRNFVPARRQISRLESKKKSPVFSHFSESLNGTSVIRAYGCQSRFSGESAKRVDAFQEMLFYNASVDRWMCIRLDMFNLLCFFVTVCLALKDRERISGAEIGLLVNCAMRLNWELIGIIRVSGNIERSVVSIERIGQYSSRDTEAALHTTTKPPGKWPDQGVVDINGYSLRYRPDTELVLKDINVSVKQGEKVGIVGRTGAGKSSLTIGLFRLVEAAEGSIHIDGLDVKHIGLFDLRSNLTILPQEPVLFSGTLKNNLDPMNMHSDEAIYNELEHAHLKRFVTSLPGKLKYECGEGGQNLSVGQRQLICLARSLLRKSKVLVLDEATAAVDLQTDELIQKTIKAQFKDCTVLTIAHRLNTIIDYDRILVLSQGEVAEFDSPTKLLHDKSSIFYSMAKDANLVS